MLFFGDIFEVALEFLEGVLKIARSRKNKKNNISFFHKKLENATENQGSVFQDPNKSSRNGVQNRFIF